MGFRLDIPDILDTTNETLSDLAKLINPYTNVEFFQNLKQKDEASITVIILWAIPSLLACSFITYMVYWKYLLAALFVALLIGLWYGSYLNRLLLLLGLFVFSAYFIHLAYLAPVKYSVITSIKLGYVYWMVSVFVPAIMGSILHSSGEHLVGRAVSKEESSSIAVYSMSPALISGIFRLFIESIVLHYLILAYSIYLLYVGIKTRFGFGRAIHCFLVLMIASSIIGMLLFLLTVMLLGIPTLYY